MSKSAPRDLCWIAKQLHDKELGGDYRITSRDMKEAKDFLIAGGGEIPDPDTVVTFAKNFFQSTFHGWHEQNFPLWGLFRNWNTFAPKQSRPRLKVKKCQIHGLEYDSPFCPQCFTEPERISNARELS